MRKWAAGSVFLGFIMLGLSLPQTAAEARPPPAHTSCRTITNPQVVALFHQWNRALLTKQTETVVADYAADATLFPTVQNGPLIGAAEIGKYFTYFLKQSPQATVETRTIHTGCDIAYDIGLYTFTVDGEQPGVRKQIKARYTFVYIPVHGKWLIAHHHSSAVPVPSP